MLTQDSTTPRSAGNHSYRGMARLEPGVAPERAALETARIMNAGNGAQGAERRAGRDAAG